MKAIGYVRVSTDMQERDGLSLDAARDDQELLQSNGLTTLSRFRWMPRVART